MVHLKCRIYYIVTVFIVLILGMSSREFSDSLPLFISNHVGDGLWASMIYFGLRAMLMNKNLFWSFWISMIFCFCIEFSQLYQASWLTGVRNSLIGSLVLGKGFLILDLIRYSVGIVLSLLIDRYLLKFKSARLR